MLGNAHKIRWAVCQFVNTRLSVTAQLLSTTFPYQNICHQKFTKNIYLTLGIVNKEAYIVV